MSLSARLALTFAIAIGGACGARTGAFLCFSDEECRLGGDQGTCEPIGYCSFVDDGCETGKRYGEFAGDSLGGRCVPPGGGNDLDGGPDAAPLPACGSVGDDCCASGPECTGALTCTSDACGCAGLGAPTAGAYSRHGCAAQGDGSLWCWGSDSAGQIGNGVTGGARRKPVRVFVLTGVTAVAAGGAHTCAIASGEVYCWGDNEAGQLGVNGGDRDEPKKTSLGSATALDSAGATTCAVAGGQVHCWGRNQYGQVGDSSTVDRNRPVQVPNLSGVTQVASGVTFTCARKDDGSAWCWGSGDEGQLGNGQGVSSLVPVQVALPLVAQISAGDDQACAVTDGGEVYCWGDNELGTLGDGTTQQRRSPTRVAGLSGVAQVDVGDELACARTSAGAVHCWGANDAGQLGLDRFSPFESTPQLVTGVTDATSVVAGADHACARRAIGAIVCWGANGDGQLGDDTSDSRATPAPVQLDCF